MVSQQNVFVLHARMQRGAAGPDTSDKSQKNIGFYSNTGPDPLKKITKLKSWRSMFGHRLPVGETPLYWCFAGIIWRSAGGPMMARF